MAKPMGERMNMLDSWEAETKGELEGNESSLARWSQLDFRKYELKRILALIDLVRKKDEILQHAIKVYNEDYRAKHLREDIQEVLALTEQLK